MPPKTKQDHPWRQMTDGEGNVAGAFNQQTGNRRLYIGGQLQEQQGVTGSEIDTLDPMNVTPDQKAYLTNLARTNPEEYARLRARFIQ